MTDTIASSADPTSLEPRPLPADDALTGLDLEDLGRVWFIGIGGSGMAPLALILHEQGVPVAGSDRAESHYAQELEAAGVRVVIGQKAENIHGVDTVVWSSAIPIDQCEMAEARRQHLRLAHRSDILALLLRTRRSIAVAGTHGKTTTSSMIAAILESAGRNPSFAIGGSLKTPRGVVSGGHAGAGQWMVAEADESDGSFAKYSPAISVITNAEGDHLDHYRTVENYRAAFSRFAAKSQGSIVLCGDDEGARQIYSAFDEAEKDRTVVYSTASEDSWKGLVPAGHLVLVRDAKEIADPGIEPFGSSDGSDASSATGDEDALTRLEDEARTQPLMEEFRLVVPAALDIRAAGGGRRAVAPGAWDVRLCVPGLHNARNAAAAILAGVLAGLPVDAAVHGVGEFLGAARRFDFQGQVAGERLYTDYGHHPTEVATFLAALRARYPRRRILALFQPHSFSRVQEYAPQYASALSTADEAVLAPVFPARERQEDFPGITSKTICEKASDDQLRHLLLADSLEQGADRIVADSRPGDVLATIGAGSIDAMNPRILRGLKARENDRGEDREARRAGRSEA